MQFWLGICSALLAVLVYEWIREDKDAQPTPAHLPVAYNYVSPFLGDTLARLPSNSFVYAAKRSIPSVVHIRIQKERYYDTFLHQFFFEDDQKPPPAMTAGSGVIISSDGYIATNYHVVENADKVEIILNDNRAFEAELVGIDPPTDLALLRIQATNLQPISMGDSDSLEIGAWVLAVGNPFELRSTVTAGIISAKARHINTISDSNNFGIESFIQTDAVVNQGNSGGALVNLRGELVGINTAIFTRTGSYQGYSFAVPVSLVQKVMEDLRIYGSAQRAILGVTIRDVDAKLAKDKGLPYARGVFIVDVFEESAAAESGLEAEDVILAIDGKKVLTTPQLQEKIGRKRPRDRIRVSILRQGLPKDIEVTLKEMPKNMLRQ